ncbi:hypothetical protein [Sphingomonas sp. EC-HK361]|uniref:hypothetical protein n=1 Tax=Sphingomonas sp. EC-HK361 TaxID=2038397 RepID=UPI00125F00EB|nr:hypothetical protein [Sphingomonas sp. EC-HK361]
MRSFLPKSGVAAGIAVLAGIAATAALAGSDRKPVESPQVKFDKAVAGLTPGKPMTCLRERTPTSLTAIGNKLLYRASAKLIYVNETTGGCENVARGDTLITKSYGGGLCRGDIAQTVDLPARIPTGSCALGDFTPYRR